MRVIPTLPSQADCRREVSITKENDVTTVSINIYKHNGLLGQSHFEGFRDVILQSVMLEIVDENGKIIVTAPLDMKANGGVIEADGTEKEESTWICFSVQTKLLPKSHLSFVEIVTHGRQWTDVYFGEKPKPKLGLTGSVQRTASGDR